MACQLPLAIFLYFEIIYFSRAFNCKLKMKQSGAKVKQTSTQFLGLEGTMQRKTRKEKSH